MHTLDLSSLKGLNGKPIRRLFRLLKPERAFIKRLYWVSILSGLFGLVVPLCIQAIFTFIQAGQASASLWVLLSFLLIGLLISGNLTLTQLNINETLQQRLFARIGFDFTERIPRWRSDDHHAPEMVNRFFEVLTIQKSLSKVLIDFFSALLQVFFGLLLLSFYHPLFIVFGLASIGTIIVAFRIMGPNGMKSSLGESSSKYAMVYWLEEVARFIDVFKLSGAPNLPVQKSNALVEKYVDYRTEHYKILRNHYIMLIGFKIITITGLIMLGTFLVFNEMISIGQFIASEIVMVLVIQSVEKIIFCIDPIYDTLTAVEKLGGIADLPLAEHTGTTEITPGAISISLDHVGVPPTDMSFSADISEHQIVGIVGANGSGKTTLINLLGTRVPDTTGVLKYSGVRVEALQMDSLRSRIGEIIEDTDIFAGTVRENISLGRPGVNDLSIREACEGLGCWDDLQRLPKGLDTALTPGAPGLPRSLAMKISLARGVVTQPSLLLIDATLVTLTRSERTKILDYLTREDRPWTLIASIHHHDFMQRCDQILHLEKGKVGGAFTLEEAEKQSFYTELMVY